MSEEKQRLNNVVSGVMEYSWMKLHEAPGVDLIEFFLTIRDECNRTVSFLYGEDSEDAATNE